jgi:hypothetical protein
MTDQELKDLVAGLAAKSDRIDAQMAKTDAQMAKTDAKLERLVAMCGGISSNQGAVSEEFFFNSLNARPMLGGIRFDSVSPNVAISRGKKQAEFDIVMYNGKSIAVVEVKYKVHPSDIDGIEANLARYREFFPMHKDLALYGAIAGLSIPAAAVKAAHERGFAVLKRVGDVMESEAVELRSH